MKNKAVSLRGLKKRLRKLESKRETLEEEQYYEDGKVNFEKVIELRDLVTDIMLLRKQIDLLIETGNYLGDTSHMGYKPPN